jgi:uncharacterized OB-fold protein
MAAGTEPVSDLGVGRPTKRRNGVVAGGLPVADSRPQLVDGRVTGVRCVECRYSSPQSGQPWCPVCYAVLEPDAFGPDGMIWSSTVVGIPVGRREAPFALAYVDLYDGPRVLVHLDRPEVLPIGTAVAIRGTADGDLVATAGERS